CSGGGALLALPPAGGPTRRGTNTGETYGTSLALSAVPGTQIGDALVASFYANASSSSNNTVTPPDGWTAAFTSVQQSGAGQLFVFTKAATSSDLSGTYTFTLSVGSGDTEWGFTGIVAAIGGVSATPDAVAYQNDAGAASMATPSISPSASNDYLIAIA